MSTGFEGEIEASRFTGNAEDGELDWVGIGAYIVDIAQHGIAHAFSLKLAENVGENHKALAVAPGEGECTVLSAVGPVENTLGAALGGMRIRGDHGLNAAQPVRSP